MPDLYKITPEFLLNAYRKGIFPMAENRDDPELQWFKPIMRGIIPLNDFHLPRRLRRTVLSTAYDIVTNQNFIAVIDGCAEPAPGREETWINDEIRRLFIELHQQNKAHSIEVWENGHLVGGLYGLAIGGAFFGESMFSRKRDVSKIALVHLVARLRLGGFVLLDTQFITDHLMQFGALEIPHDVYDQYLQEALMHSGRWIGNGDKATILETIQMMHS